MIDHSGWYMVGIFRISIPKMDQNCNFQRESDERRTTLRLQPTSPLGKGYRFGPSKYARICGRAVTWQNSQGGVVVGTGRAIAHPTHPILGDCFFLMGLANNLWNFLDIYNL